MNTNRLITIGLVLLLGLASIGGIATWFFVASPPAPAAEGRDLKVITFNVQFLPGIAGLANQRVDPEYRARTLGKLLASYDIVGLNEVFDPGHRAILLNELRNCLGDDYHCATPAPQQQSAFGIGSGLAIVSRLSILASHSMAYGNDSSVWKYGFAADGFAAKGALHARISRGGAVPESDCLDVFVTHLESTEAAAREDQYPRLAQFIRTHAAPDQPSLILGDFNTVGDPPDQHDPLLRISGS
jgi:endonuclease/exonuclease/phosphatase family metal-dependent hydrolase